MNIFYLHSFPTLAAEAHCDRHVVKMVLETAQLLSTAYRELKLGPWTDGLYKSTHRNHPCAVWVRESGGNYYWTWRLLRGLLHEYHYRWGRHHATQRLLLPLRPPQNGFSTEPMTEPAQAMPEQYQIPGNPVKAYRDYYIGEKKRLLTYTRRTPPHWVAPWVRHK